MAELTDISKAFELGLKLETEGYEFYNSILSRVTDGEVKKLFKFLAKEERRHYLVIEQLFSKYALDGYQSFLSNFHGDFEQTGVFQQLDETKMELGDEYLLELAILTEQRAIKYFSYWMSQTINPDVVKAFELLKNQEEGHIKLLESKKKQLYSK